MIGMLAFVITGLVPTFLMGGNPIVEMVEAGKRDRALRGTPSEAPRGPDGTQREGERWSNVTDAHTGTREPLETLPRVS